MSVLDTYVNWANSVLAETGDRLHGLKAVTDGKVLCQIIDILAPNADLQAKVEASGDCRPLTYINTALGHMKSHGIIIKFHAEDIVHNEIKSMLDVLWLLILNYGIHFIGQNAKNRSVAAGKKKLLRWCQEELATSFDYHETLSTNLCDGGWFVRLLEHVTRCSVQKQEDMSDYVDDLLTEIQRCYFIKKDIIKGSDVVDGTVEEHALMIYLSLLKRRISNFKQQRPTNLPVRSKSAQSAQEASQNYDRFSSKRRQSGLDNSALTPGHSQSLHDLAANETESFSTQQKVPQKEVAASRHRSHKNELQQPTVSERAMKNFSGPIQVRDWREETDSRTVSDTQTEFSGSSVTRDDYLTPLEFQQQKQMAAEGWNGSSYDGKNRLSAIFSSPSNYSIKVDVDTDIELNGLNSSLHEGQKKLELQEDSHKDEESREESMRIMVQRPRDYTRQWEDTIDRLSSVSATDKFGVPRTPLISNYKVSASSRSKSSDAAGRASANTNIKTFRSKSTDAVLKDPGTSSDAFTCGFDNNYTENDQLTSSAERIITTGEVSESAVFQVPEKGDEIDTTLSSDWSRHVALIDVLRQARENVHCTVPDLNCESQSAQLQNLDKSCEQTVLKKRNCSPSSDSRTEIQRNSGTSWSTGQPQPEGSHLNKHTSLSLSLGLHPASHQIQAVDSYEQPEDNESRFDYIPSASQRSRSLTPKSSTGNERGHVTRSPGLQESTSDRFLPSSYPFRENLKVRSLHLKTGMGKDQELTVLRTLNLSPRRTTIGSKDQIYTPGSISTERIHFDKIHSEKTGIGQSWNSNNSTTHKDMEILKYKGEGRVPRREAWEKERKIKKSGYSLDRPVGSTTGELSEIIRRDKELDILKEKSLTEEGSSRRNGSLYGRSPSSEKNFSLRTLYSKGEALNKSGQTDFAQNTDLPVILSPGTGSQRQFSDCFVAPSTNTEDSTRAGNSDVKSFFKLHNQTRSPDFKSNIIFSRDQGHSLRHELNLDYGRLAYGMNPEIKVCDISSVGDLKSNRKEKWRHLISHSNLSETEVTELKQALACAVVENDILEAKLSNAHHEIHDKLRHTNAVLDDCRQHLTKVQTENMELRTSLAQEKQKNETSESRIKDLETNVYNMKMGSRQLEDKLDETFKLLEHSMSETKTGVDALQAENSALIVRLATLQSDNEALLEDVHLLKRDQTKAMNTVDELKECLSVVKQERQKLLNEISWLKQQQQTARVREIISSSCQEKGAQDEQERELDQLKGADKSSSPQSSDQFFLPPGISGSHDLCSVYTHDDADIQDRFSRSLDTHSAHTTYMWSPDQYEHDDDLSYREIYPHRKYYIPHNRNSSKPRSLSAASSRHNSPLSENKSHLDTSLRQQKQVFLIDTTKDRFEVSSQASIRAPYTSRLRDQESVFNPKHAASADHLNRSFSSEEFFQQRNRSSSPSLRSHCSNKITASDRLDRSISADQSPSYTQRRDFSQDRRRRPDNENKPREVSINQLQKMDRDEKIPCSVGRSSLLKSSSKFGINNESDGDDTGINSSMSSHSSLEYASVRKSAPLLSDEQRRYADELIQKYTGKSAQKSSADLL